MTEAQSVIMLLGTCLAFFVASLLMERPSIAILWGSSVSSLNIAAWVSYGIAVNWIPSLGTRQLIGAFLMVAVMIIPVNLVAAAMGFGAARVTRFAAMKLLKL